MANPKRRRVEIDNSFVAALVKTPQLTFENVGGLEEAKKILSDHFIKPFVAAKSNSGMILKPGPGVLFHGKPGTGKTYLAEALAGELQKALGQEVKFIPIGGAHIANKYFGETEKMVLEIFKFLKENSPSVLFLDELDTLTPTRSSDSGSSATHYNGITACFLTQLQEIDRTKTIVIAATNRLNSLDAAIIRSGRLESHIGFLPPSPEERSNVLEVVAQKRNLKFSNLNQFLTETVERTKGATPADLENLVDKIIIQAWNRGHQIAYKEDWVSAIKEFENSQFSYRYKFQPIEPHLKIATASMVKSIYNKIESQLDKLLDPSLEGFPMKKILIEGQCHFLNRGIVIGLLNKCSPETIPVFKINCEKDGETIEATLEEAKSISKGIICMENIQLMSSEQLLKLYTYMLDLAAVPGNKFFIIATSIKNIQPNLISCMFQESERVCSEHLGTFTEWLDKYDNNDEEESEQENEVEDDESEKDSDYESSEEEEESDHEDGDYASDDDEEEDDQ